MKNIINKLKLMFTYGPEIEKVLAEIADQNREIERQANRYRLKLCGKHKQEANQSHYAEHNCDYCKLQNQRTDAAEYERFVNKLLDFAGNFGEQCGAWQNLHPEDRTRLRRAAKDRMTDILRAKP